MKLEMEEPLDEKRVRLHKRARDASTSCRHLLQCPQTLLSKNFEKLINCDPHLKLLRQQPDIILESSYFNPEYSVLEDRSDSKSHISDVIKDDSRTTFFSFYEQGHPFAASSISNKTETQDSFGRTPDFDSQDTRSPCSGNNISSNCITFR
ncbi:hypothetical protein ZIOFF_018588 [Zingiber officinale]|uniref:Uncharacterized protein n=1 Tax=Zingiber officinale TaxID=94328 RepID=A0A8J5H8F9_ZINOF|nr:hypothetical protein ZIOFF_018588 [Zingiber officinale]